MKNIFAFLLIFLGTFAFSQVPRFQKFKVSDTAVHLYLPAEPKWDKSPSDDGSSVYTTEVDFGNISYKAIVVELSNDVMKDLNDSKFLLEQYMTFIEDSVLQLKEKASNKGTYTLESQPKAIGIKSMGKDVDGIESQIKGWFYGKNIAILIMSSKSEMNYNFQEIYLNSIRFP